MATHADGGDTRVTAAGSLRGRHGEVEIVVQHSPVGLDERHDHRFVYRYEYDEEQTPEGFTHSGAFVSWQAEAESIRLETFLALSHVEQYLHHYGVSVDPTLAPGMYPMINVDETDTFADDPELDVELPGDG